MTYELNLIQKECVQKFWKSGNLLAVLPTGTGKTLVALDIISTLLQQNKESKILIIVPANLRSNFLENISKFKLKIHANIIKTQTEFSSSYDDPNTNCLVISYNFLRMYFDLINSYQWSLVITDELHYAKNLTSQTFRKLIMLRQHTKHFLGLTASPIANTPQEFFAIVAIVANNKNIIHQGMSIVKYSNDTTIITRLIYKLRGKKLPRAKGKPVGIKDAKLFKQLVAQWVYIPKFEKVSKLGTRPELKSFVIYCELSSFERKAYHYSLSKISPLELVQLKQGTISDAQLRKIKNEIMAAQQTLLSPDYIYRYNNIENMEELDSTITLQRFRPGTKIIKTAQLIKKFNEKTLVFSTFLSFGARLANLYLNSVGIKSAEYSGHIKANERLSIVKDFEEGDLQVICMTGAGQEGINLPSCKHIVFLNLPWHQEILRQVIGRALRITSQNKFVNVYWLFARDNGKETIDDWVSAIIKRKSTLRNEIFNILQEDFVGNVAAALPGIETYEPVGYKAKKKKVPNELPMLSPYPDE